MPNFVVNDVKIRGLNMHLLTSVTVGRMISHSGCKYQIFSEILKKALDKKMIL